MGIDGGTYDGGLAAIKSPLYFVLPSRISASKPRAVGVRYQRYIRTGDIRRYTAAYGLGLLGDAFLTFLTFLTHVRVSSVYHPELQVKPGPKEMF